jgi:hypothetical protein
LFSPQLFKEILWWETILRYLQSDMLVLLHIFRPETICVLVSSVHIILHTVSPSYLNIIITVIIKRPIIHLTITVTVNIHVLPLQSLATKFFWLLAKHMAFWRLRSSRLWQCNVGWVDASISNDHSTFLLASEEGGTQ